MRWMLNHYSNISQRLQQSFMLPPPMKMRKLLITAGVYSTDISRIIGELHAEGKSASEIQAITGLKKSSINGYLPYSKIMYNHDEKMLELSVLAYIEREMH